MKSKKNKNLHGTRGSLSELIPEIKHKIKLNKDIKAKYKTKSKPIDTIIVDNEVEDEVVNIISNNDYDNDHIIINVNSDISFQGIPTFKLSQNFSNLPNLNPKSKLKHYHTSDYITEDFGVGHNNKYRKFWLSTHSLKTASKKFSKISSFGMSDDAFSMKNLAKNFRIRSIHDTLSDDDEEDTENNDDKNISNSSNTDKTKVNTNIKASKFNIDITKPDFSHLSRYHNISETIIRDNITSNSDQIEIKKNIKNDNTIKYSFNNELSTDMDSINLLDSSSKLDPADEASPRGAYLKESIIRNLVPIPIADLFRSNRNRSRFLECEDKDLDNDEISIINNELVSINLKNKGLGDDKAKCLAVALPKCPFVTTINLAGNRLTDVSMAPILKAILKYMSCTSINLSDNKLDEKSIDLLKDNFLTKKCKISELHLSKSDIDDKECAQFMDAIFVNNSLQILNLSHNLIGGKEEYNNVFPDFITGGEAIASVLEFNMCAMKKLDLSWNNIRGDSAMTLVKSLRVNKHLETLNLAHNNIGDLSAQYLGHYLLKNTTLKNLDISFNKLFPKSIFVLANCLGQNKSIENINLNGNAVGKYCGSLLVKAMRLVASKQGRLLGCMFQDANMYYEDKSLIDLDDPSGEYEFNLEEPYEFAAAQCLINIINIKAGVDVKLLSYSNKESGINNMKINLIKPNVKISVDDWETDAKNINMCIDNIITAKNENKNIDSLKKKATISIQEMGKRMRLNIVYGIANKIRISLEKLHINHRIKVSQLFLCIFSTVFQIVDTDKSNSLDVDELAKTLEILGVQLSGKSDNEYLSHAKRMISGADIIGDATLELNEFLRMLLVSYTETNPNPPLSLVDSSTNKPYVLPESGIVKIHIKIEPLPPSNHELESDKSIETFSNAMSNVLHTGQAKLGISSDLFLNCEQADILLGNFREQESSKISIIEHFLPQMSTTFEACKLLAQNLHFAEIINMRLKLGYNFTIYTGNCSGHYVLDLGKPDDQKAVARLAQLNNLERLKGMQDRPTRDTSQVGDWENFRNEVLNNKYERITSKKIFSGKTKVGKLRFDYVQTVRPIDGIEPISDIGLFNFILTIFPDVSKDEEMKKIKILEDRKNILLQFSKVAEGRSSRRVLFKDSEDEIRLKVLHELEETKEKEENELLLTVCEMKGGKTQLGKFLFSLKEKFDKDNGKTKIKLNKNEKSKEDFNFNKNEELIQLNLKNNVDRDIVLWKDFIESSWVNYCKISNLYLKQCYNEALVLVKEANLNKEVSEEAITKQCFAHKKYKDGIQKPIYNIDLLNIENKRKSEDEKTIVKELIDKCLKFELNLIYLEVHLVYNIWLSSSQTLTIIQVFMENNAPDPVIVRALCILFSRIIDLENFYLILDYVTHDIKMEIIHRLGYLNVCSSLQPYGFYEIDFASRDHREMAKIIFQLQDKEKGYFKGHSKYNSRLEKPYEPYELPPSWCESDTQLKGGPPNTGYITFNYQIPSDPNTPYDSGSDDYVNPLLKPSKIIGTVDIIKRKILFVEKFLGGSKGSLIKGYDRLLAKNIDTSGLEIDIEND